MSDHDPLCEVDVHGNFCQCCLIAKVRADERERMHDVYHMEERVPDRREQQ